MTTCMSLILKLATPRVKIMCFIDSVRRQQIDYSPKMLFLNKTMGFILLEAHLLHAGIMIYFAI